MAMRKPLLGVLLMLTAACALEAQEVNLPNVPAKSAGNVAASFGSTSPADATLLAPSGDATKSGSFALTTSGGGSAEADAFPPEPPAAPAAKPKYVFGDRDDYRWQLAVGVEFFRFQSNLINASMVGTNTTITYYTNDWFAVEGNVVTGFAPQIYDREHVKYLGGGGGFRIGTRRARFEPWGHGLVGGGHLQPQTAGNGKNALTVQAGMGLDYRVNSRLSIRAEGDYVYSRFFNSTQNNFQAVAAAVFHF
jgi:opacity protein-like surface antigen